MWSDIPEAWRVVRLDEVAQTASGGTPRRSNDGYFGGGIPWVKSGELEENSVEHTEETLTDAGLQNSSAKIFPEGTLLVAMYGATVGRTGILKVPAATNQAVCAVFPDEEYLDKMFVYYFFRWKRPTLLATSFGGAQPNISQRVIRGLEIPVPPLEEQQRIVARIEKLTRRIEEAKGLRRAAVEQAEKIMPAALAEVFRRAEEEGWESEPLTGVAPITSDTVEPSEWPDREFNYLSLEHIESHSGRLADFSPTSGKEIRSSKLRFSTKHVLYGKLRPYLNKVLVPSFDGVCTTELVPLEPVGGRLSREFLAWYLRSPQFVRYAMANVTGTRMPRTSMRALKAAEVPLPPLEEQRRIAGYVEGCQGRVDTIRRLQRETQAQLEALIPIVLARAFRGEL